MLTWTHDQDGCWAASCMHDDGSPFMYEFKKTPAGWENETTAELIHGPSNAIFPTSEAAKRWAEQTEAKWRKADAT